MEKAIEEGSGQDGIREEAALGGIGFVGGENDGSALLVPFRDDLEEKGCAYHSGYTPGCGSWICVSLLPP